MSDLEQFWFEDSGDSWEVRFVGTPDVPEWVANDVVNILYPQADQRNYSNYLGKVPSEWKGHKQVMTPGGLQEMTTLFEPGLYHLIARSDSPKAIPFQKWVFEDVLPRIRKTGAYSVAQPTQVEPVLLPVRVRKEKLELIQIGIDILSQLGGIDERTELQFKDLTRSIVLDDVLQTPALPGGEERLEWPISDRATALGYKPTPGQLKSIGRGAAALYRARYGKEPPKREQFVDGATRSVNSYSSKDLPILDQAIKAVMDKSKNA